MSDFILDPDGDLARNQERKRMEKARFFPGAPPLPSKMGGLEPPYCPFVSGCVGIPVSESNVILGQKQVQIQVQQTRFPCSRNQCLFWDRHMNRCGITSLLEYMANVEEEDADEGDEEGEEQGEVKDATAGGEVPAQG